MNYIKTEEEIALLRENGILVSKTLAEVGRHIAPGVTTKELDALAETYIRDHGAVPAFLGYNGFPIPYVSPSTLWWCTEFRVITGCRREISFPSIAEQSIRVFLETRLTHLP